MFLGTITKQPSEIIPIDIDYSKVIGDRTASSISLTVTPPSGMAMESAEADATERFGQVYVSGGTDATAYKWTVQADIVIAGKTTRVEDEFTVQVAEITADTSAASQSATPVGASSGWPAIF